MDAFVRAIVCGMWTRRAWLATGFLVVLACGSRTGLFVDETYEVDDAGPDANLAFDGGHDAGRDAARDAAKDTLVPFDVFKKDVEPIRDCPDAASTLVYVITQSYELFSFYPPTGQFKEIGVIACPNAGNSTPFSMAVDRNGIARVVFVDQSGAHGLGDGNLYRVSTATAACQATPFVPGQNGMTTFGMGYASDDLGGGETLYIAGDGINGSPTDLARIDKNYNETLIGPFFPPIHGAELTGTGGGGLFAFYSHNSNTDPDSFIGQLDKQSGQVIGETILTGVSQGSGWAFGFWGGDFYVFTQPGSVNGSQVTRYRPSDGSIAVVAQLPSVIVGAGVSTCAPQQ